MINLLYNEINIRYREQMKDVSVEGKIVKVLVTGGASNSMALEVIDKLIGNGIDVVIADNCKWNMTPHLSGKASYYEVVLHKELLTPIFKKEKVDIVLHLKSEPITSNKIRDSFDQSEENIHTTTNVLEACAEAKVQKVIFPSTISVYGNQTADAAEDTFLDPFLFEGLSKKMEEQYVMHYHKLYGLNFSILRFADIYGIDNGGIIAENIERVKDGHAPVIYGTGQEQRNFLYIDDATDAILASLTKGDNQVINIAANCMHSLEEAAISVSETVGKLEPVYYSNEDELVSICPVSVQKAKELLGWEAKIPLWEGLQKTLQEYKVRKHL